uniref:hypothetical protein n=1 Tax=Salmonella sp. TaxID=599 RepID=UPI001CDA0606|nr:hypothetical protein [Salmonella sp.]
MFYDLKNNQTPENAISSEKAIVLAAPSASRYTSRSPAGYFLRWMSSMALSCDAFVATKKLALVPDVGGWHYAPKRYITRD